MRALLVDPNSGQAPVNETELPVYPGVAREHVVLVMSDTQAGEALVALMAADVIGFDTESKPTFLKGEKSGGPHLIQLATDERAYLFPISRSFEPKGIKSILESSTVRKVGFGLGNDLGALKSRFDITMANVLDLGETLRGPAHRGTVGAKYAVAQFFGQRFLKSKKIGTSNWASSHLTERQIMYAANDAFAALQIYRAWAASSRHGRDCSPMPSLERGSPRESPT